MNINLTNEMVHYVPCIKKSQKYNWYKKDYMAKNKKSLINCIKKSINRFIFKYDRNSSSASIPSIKLVKSFSGCTKSIEGYPLEEDESNALYSICIGIANKIKGSFEPWNSLSKMTEIKIEMMVSTFIKKYMLNNEISERLSSKLNYLLMKKWIDIDINIYRAWDNFTFIRKVRNE